MSAAIAEIPGLSVMTLHNVAAINELNLFFLRTISSNVPYFLYVILYFLLILTTKQVFFLFPRNPYSALTLNDVYSI